MGIGKLTRTLKFLLWDDVQIYNDLTLGMEDFRRGDIVAFEGRKYIMSKGTNDPDKTDPLGQHARMKPYNPLTEIWVWFLQKPVEAAKYRYFYATLKELINEGYLDAPEGVYPGFLKLARTYTDDPWVREHRMWRRGTHPNAKGINYDMRAQALLEELNTGIKRDHPTWKVSTIYKERDGTITERPL